MSRGRTRATHCVGACRKCRLRVARRRDRKRNIVVYSRELHKNISGIFIYSCFHFLTSYLYCFFIELFALAVRELYTLSSLSALYGSLKLISSLVRLFIYGYTSFAIALLRSPGNANGNLVTIQKALQRLSSIFRHGRCPWWTALSR